MKAFNKLWLYGNSWEKFPIKDNEVWCAGKGLTGKTAYILGKTFYGTEINKRRLACLIDYYHQQGLIIHKLKEY